MDEESSGRNKSRVDCAQSGRLQEHSPLETRHPKVHLDLYNVRLARRGRGLHTQQHTRVHQLQGGLDHSLPERVERRLPRGHRVQYESIYEHVRIFAILASAGDRLCQFAALVQAEIWSAYDRGRYRSHGQSGQRDDQLHVPGSRVQR